MALWLWPGVGAQSLAVQSDPADPAARAARRAPGDGAHPAMPLDLPEGSRPVVVRVAFHLLDVNRIDDESEEFEFSGVLTVSWRDARQAFDPVSEGVADKLYHGDYQFNELSPAWYPQVFLANASGACERQGVICRVKPDGTTILTETINAVARSRLYLQRYPFDRQRLEAVFGVLGFDARDVVIDLGPESASADLERIRVPQWELTNVRASIRTMAAPYTDAGGSCSAFVLTLDVKRQSWFMVRLVMLPLLLVVMLSWCVFWMDRSSLGDRMSVSFVGILTAVAYQMVVSDILPQISYVTLLNAFLNFSFWIMCASVVINLVVGAYDKRGDRERGERIDRRCRWVFPLVYAGLMVLTASIALLAP
ncbi:MAG TPA: hypothetical protein PKM73_15195 [Verrucomicrobiota bacterium]|nr:hypothetical protein [Verrucomicrobiota bacterium]HNU52678.1 hypothetical protein [Verrucomicrobiota bacterium]